MEGFGNGLDGDLTISSSSSEAPIDSTCSGTVGTTSLTATNASFAAGQLLLIHKSRGLTTTTAGAWELNKIASYATGTITLAYPLQFTYNDSGDDQSQVRVLKQYNNVTINGSQVYSSKAWNENVGGIIGWFAKGTTTITGTVQGTGLGYLQGNHGGQFAHGFSGEGTLGARTQSGAANGNGGAGKQSEGSGGGNGAAAINNPTSAGAGGAAAGAADLTSMVFGGGGGGAGDGSVPNGHGIGGSGGAIVAIFSQYFTMSGAITLTGNANESTACESGHRGGGGAGGSCLIKCKTAVLGTNLITALAGSATANGSAGAVGRIHVDYKTSLTGTTNPTLDSTNDLSLDYPTPGAAFLYNFV